MKLGFLVTAEADAAIGTMHDLVADHLAGAKRHGRVTVTDAPLHATGRQLYLAECLLLAARDEDDPPKTWDEHVKLACEYGASAVPKPQPSEFDFIRWMPVGAMFGGTE